MAGARSAVLASGGLDSVVLMAHEVAEGREVWPLHVRVGLAWEEAEAAALARVASVAPLVDRIRPLTTLHVDTRELYPSSHWAVAGTPRGWDEPDESVYLEGRNLTLLARAGVFCATARIGRIVLGPLAGNPFPDARPEFFEAMARALSLGLDIPIAIAAPFRTMHKAEVVALGQQLGVPLERTLSCNGPIDDRHCGRCNKCRERHEAFVEAGIEDRTTYVVPPPRTSYF